MLLRYRVEPVRFRCWMLRRLVLRWWWREWCSLWLWLWLWLCSRLLDLLSMLPKGLSHLKLSHLMRHAIHERSSAQVLPSSGSVRDNTMRMRTGTCSWHQRLHHHLLKSLLWRGCGCLRWHRQGWHKLGRLYRLLLHRVGHLHLLLDVDLKGLARSQARRNWHID